MKEKLDLIEFARYINQSERIVVFVVLLFGLIYLFFELFIEWNHLFVVFAIGGALFCWWLIKKERRANPSYFLFLKRVRNAEGIFYKLNPIQQVELIEKHIKDFEVI